MNVTDVLIFFAAERIKIGKEESGTSAVIQAYDKFQAKQKKFKDGTAEGSWTDQPVASHHHACNEATKEYIHTLSGIFGWLQI